MSQGAWSFCHLLLLVVAAWSAWFLWMRKRVADAADLTYENDRLRRQIADLHITLTMLHAERRGGE